MNLVLIINFIYKLIIAKILSSFQHVVNIKSLFMGFILHLLFVC